MSATNDSSKLAHLNPSALGTREYWDSLYTTEITNHAHDPSDVGTVWFDDSDAEAKIVDFLEDLSQDKSQYENAGLITVEISEEETSFLDLGTGNGSLLFSLRDAGWSGRMLGVDYSEQSVELARRVSASRRRGGKEDHEEGIEDDLADGDGGVEEEVEFLHWDVLTSSYNPVLMSSTPQSEGWDIVLDKGTFDAISLSDERDAAGRRICEGYRARVLRLVGQGGLFLVTSCNWTEAELKAWFEGVREDDDEELGGGFVLVGRVEYRSFSFGGVKGQTISSLCFVKVGGSRP